MDSIVVVNKLTKSYGERKALDAISFSISKGEVVGLLGPNGAGKSTTMKILTGFMSPTSGSVQICGYDVFENPIEVKKRIGFLPENPPLYLDMSVEKYLIYVAQLKQVRDENITEYVLNALTKTNLLEVKNRRIKNLSKGFKQRVGIAQALVSKPEILILDEPTVGLDPKQVAEIRELIIQLKNEYTIILSTHILSEVEATCDKIIIIHHGRIVIQDRLENINLSLESNDQIHQLKIKETFDLSTLLKNLDDVKSVETKDSRNYIIRLENGAQNIEKVMKIIFENKLTLIEYNLNEHSLENVFLELTYNSEVGKA
jgi:ABC-2 type transport system ATP-binding protein